jgi:transcriptional regulator of acetoin/glycerol metabolism
MPIRGASQARRRDSGALAVTRERYLSGDEVRPDGLRPQIWASWMRSRTHGVPVTPRVDLPHQPDLDLGAPLVQLARPVLADLAEQLAPDPVSVILTDARGLVLLRYGRIPRLLRHLDRVQLAPGFSYAEQQVGTNGIGTAAETGEPTLVMGHEHYVEHLEQLSCAGVPIRNPLSGVVVGILDLTAWSSQPGSMLMALAAATARHIEGELLAHLTRREQTLLAEYLRSCQHTGGGVLALNPDLVMMNDYLRTHVTPADQAALLARSADAVGAGDPMTLIAELPSGAVARLAFAGVAFAM